MAIATLDQLIAGAKQIRPIYKASVTAKAAGSFQSLWTAAGLPGAGSAPGTVGGAICDNTTVGALAFTSPGGANLAYLAAIEMAGATQGLLIVYDRLVATGALNGTLTTAQTVGSAALTRYTTGVDVECFVEIYTATGATAATATVSYTNQAGTAGRTGTASIPTSPVAGQMIPVTLQAGDSGVQSVQSVTLSISTGTAGAFGVTLLKRLAHVPAMVANVGQVLDFGALGLPQIQSAACIAFAVLPSTTSTGVFTGAIKTVEG